MSETMTRGHRGVTQTFADAYAEYLGPAIFEPLAEVSMSHARPLTGERALDLACGTGILTRRLAAAVAPDGAVVGVDVNPDMIAAALRAGVPSGARVEYVVGDATTMTPPPPPFDLATCQQGLQFLPDRRAAVRRMHAALRPGGRAVITCWRGLDAHPLFAALAEAELPHLTMLGADVTMADLIAPFAFGDGDALRAVLTDSGFTAVHLCAASIEGAFPAEDFVRRMEQAYTAVVPAFAADPAAFEAYLDAVADATRPVVEDYRDASQVVVPMHTVVAVALR
jgi:SAM-dependent methyltransferase